MRGAKLQVIGLEISYSHYQIEPINGNALRIACGWTKNFSHSFLLFVLMGFDFEYLIFNYPVGIYWESSYIVKPIFDINFWYSRLASGSSGITRWCIDFLFVFIWYISIKRCQEVHLISNDNIVTIEWPAAIIVVPFYWETTDLESWNQLYKPHSRTLIRLQPSHVTQVQTETVSGCWVNELRIKAE